MSERTDVMAISELVGRPVVSLATGNKIGVVMDVFLDALNGEILGLTVGAPDGSVRALRFDSVHSFGHDALMAVSDEAAALTAESPFPGSPNIRDLIGTKIITETGVLIGQIAGIYVTTSGTPFVFYDIRESLLDSLLGRRHFIPASAAHALSDDRERLIIPIEAAENAAASIDEMFSGPNAVRTFSPTGPRALRESDDTIVVLPEENEDETLVRLDEDDTVLRWRRGN